MNLTENILKKYLIDEILRASHFSVSEALDEVNSFSQTVKFKESFNQWRYLKSKNNFYKPEPKLIKDILMGIFND